jgi:bacterioferritin-associated ferredoxin
MTKTCPHCHATVLSTSQPERVGFISAMDVVERGFKAWKDQPHNAKWFKRIDGTPIPNDLAVNIAEAIVAALAATPALEPGAFLNDGTKIIPRPNLHPFYDQPEEAATPAVPPNCKHPGHQCFHYGLCTDTDCRNYGTSVLPATPAVGGERGSAHEAMLEMGQQADPIREALRRMIAEFGDEHYHTCPADNDSGPCECFAGHLIVDARATLAPPASPLRGRVTDEMLNAHLKSTAEWVDPYEAATECGVAIECGITQDEADQLNAQSRASLRVGYAAAFASPGTARREDQSHE